jgi:DNA-directed RNA polymerase specialized sigma24 family protein
MLRELADQARNKNIARDTTRWANVHATVDTLPEDEREVFDLMLYWGLTRPEVSGVLGISRKAVEYRWREGRLTLQDALQEGVRPEL